MKIAIDSGPLKSGHSVRGIGVHTKLLIEHLKKRGVDVSVVDFSKSNLSLFDIVHYQHFNPFRLSLPILKKTKTVITIHDLIYLLYPDYYPPGLSGKFCWFLQKILINSIVDAVITISKTSKKDIVRLLGVPEKKVYVIYLACREKFKKMYGYGWRQETRKKYKLPKEFVLYVGDVNYNKNLEGLADACKLVHANLVIVGKQAANEKIDRLHPENRPFSKFLDKYSKDRTIKRLGFIPDEELVKIYNLATVYCQPSFYEGFGFSVLEAMACGCPVIASNIGSLKEISGNAAVFVDPRDYREIGETIKSVIDDKNLRMVLSRKGLKQVRKFSWDETVSKTLRVYKKVYSEPG